MNPGRELDALIAEKVMGQTLRQLGHVFSQRVGDVVPMFEIPPPYSTDISAAWQVVERLVEMRIMLSLIPARYDNGFRWQAKWGEYSSDKWDQAPTAPHAICLAALKAVGA
jgi:hypothetical protein